MKKQFWLFFLLLAWSMPGLHAQELFVFTEPASNMAARSFGLRLDNTFYQMNPGYAYRLAPELMWGAGRKWMIHASAYASDMFGSNFHMEGGSLYAKYRFFASDAVHRHFRMAAFAKGAWVSNPDSLSWDGVTRHSDEIDLGGTNSGFQGGVVATQLVHKLALSGSLSYLHRWDPTGESHSTKPAYGGASEQAMDYTVSAGLLLLPRHYRDYRQLNVNLMCELLGSAALDKTSGYLDLAPGLQFIVNSIARIDLGYRAQVAGHMERYAANAFFLRLEYNFLNAYK